MSSTRRPRASRKALADAEEMAGRPAGPARHSHRTADLAGCLRQPLQHTPATPLPGPPSHPRHRLRGPAQSRPRQRRRRHPRRIRADIIGTTGTVTLRHGGRRCPGRGMKPPPWTNRIAGRTPFCSGWQKRTLRRLRPGSPSPRPRQGRPGNGQRDCPRPSPGRRRLRSRPVPNRGIHLFQDGPHVRVDGGYLVVVSFA
jgi:hypothetical protein